MPPTTAAQGTRDWVSHRHRLGFVCETRCYCVNASSLDPVQKLILERLFQY